MAIINNTDQIRYTGKGYLDAKMMPVKTVNDLKSISITQRFEGLTITVLNNGNPQDYWLVGGVTNDKWIPKTSNSNFNDLRLVLEEGFLKLKNGENQLGESIDFNNFFPSGEVNPDLFINTVDYSTVDAEGNTGIFMCFTYSDSTKKYLDMSNFLSVSYESGNGIVINGNIISIDEAITGKIEIIETEITELNKTVSQKADISLVQELITEEKTNRETTLNNINERLTNLLSHVNTNTQNIEINKTNISTLTERVNALSSAAEGSTPDGKTIGITEDEEKALYVKVLEKEGNILKVDSNDGETGLFASIPVFFEDEELN